MDDVRAVMTPRARSAPRSSGVGGGPMSVLFAATYPERTRALVLCGTFATGTLDPDDNPAGQRWLDKFQRVHATLDHWGEGHTLAVFAPAPTASASASGAASSSVRLPVRRWRATLIEMVVETEVRDLLPSVRVPTLVLHREEEFVPVEGARDMAEQIPGAQLVVLPGTDHIPFYGDADGYAEEIEEFLTGARRRRHPIASSRP